MATTQGHDLRRLGRTDLEIEPVSLGTNVFGWTADQHESFEVLDAFVAGGGTLLGTADSYSSFVPGNHGGESETIIGNWLTSRGCRDRVLIATKVGRARPAVPAPIASARTPEQLAAILAVRDVKLSVEEVGLLTAASPADPSEAT